MRLLDRTLAELPALCRAFWPCPWAAAGCMMRQPVRLCNALAGQADPFVGTFNAAEVVAMRPEDKDARQDQRAFASGATLADLEEYITYLRSLGAPDDAHPKVGANDNYEVTMMICVVQRAGLPLSNAF